MRVKYFKLPVLTIFIILFYQASFSQNTKTKPITTSALNGFTINILDKENSINDEIENSLINTFHNVYPKMVNDFNLNAYKSINITIDPSYDGVAYADADTGKITISSNWITNKPEDTDLLTHELMHIVQSYPAESLGWLTEGIADYVRNE